MPDYELINSVVTGCLVGISIGFVITNAIAYKLTDLQLTIEGRARKEYLERELERSPFYKKFLVETGMRLAFRRYRE